ncbi:uncharacterized protein KIAA0513 isoform X2 [Phymastichus coffea]|uniref:uncharacterized protein KIAA0513 isoform X2 n=1 Tax=Phymastichus coffea TaxID=108790 RepID=UPI00273AECE8|nr:uncharacterized protein KIAA0513 isoform X2 [Phymastichus coffea]
MVDVTAAPSSAESSSFMGRTKGALRSMRSVLGGGGEYLQGLSSRIGTALSSSIEESDPTSPSTQTSQTQPAKASINNITPIANDKVDARRKLRFPRFGNGTMYEDYDAMIRRKFDQQEMARCSRISRKYPGMTYEEIVSSRSASFKKSEPKKIEEITSLDKESDGNTKPVNERQFETIELDPFDRLYNSQVDMPSSSGSTSDADYGPSISLDSAKEWQRSGSSGSIQSWASSLSADSQSEEAAVDFMKMFVPMLFESPSKINQEQKATFGQMVLTEPGRIWFTRVVNTRRARPCVTEESFYSLAQHFALALFECHEADDFAPAKSLMNMCFTFYHEVEVPGVEPYREYLYTNLRVQPIWTSMRFWTAAFFDAVQCERAAKLVPLRPKQTDKEITASEDKRFHANIVFGQLGTFTCNMHAFGLPRNLCLEFLKKQCLIANLTPDQEQMLRDNIQRMYDETEPWRS